MSLLLASRRRSVTPNGCRSQTTTSSPARPRPNRTCQRTSTPSSRETCSPPPRRAPRSQTWDWPRSSGTHRRCVVFFSSCLFISHIIQLTPQQQSAESRNRFFLLDLGLAALVRDSPQVIYIYIYMCVCVCVCVFFSFLSFGPGPGGAGQGLAAGHIYIYMCIVFFSFFWTWAWRQFGMGPPTIFCFFVSLMSYNSHHNSRAQSREIVPAPRR